MACLDENTLVEFLERRASERERRSVEAHIDRCARCRALVATLAAQEPVREPTSAVQPDPAPAAAGALVSGVVLQARRAAADLLSGTPSGAGEEGASCDELLPGTMVGHFRVMRPLGAGAMGEVFLARDTTLGRKVALKLLHRDKVRSQRAPERLTREARAMAKLSHPHIVSVYSLGEHEGVPFLAIEYVPGETLRERMDRLRRYEGRCFGPQEALRIGSAIAEALAAAHAAGVLHRDLKPANILMGSDGRLRVLDFGLAKLFGDDDDDASAGPTHGAPQRTGVVGTPLYMAPEQWSKAPATPAVDVWAFGVLLHELLTGEQLFDRPSTTEVRAAVQRVIHFPVTIPAAGLGPEVAGVLNACLAYDAEARPPAALLAAELQFALGNRASPRSEERGCFRGLQAFGERDADLFFGREAEIAELVERLQSDVVLPIVGPSGTGKSSLVLAGLVPRLREHGPLVVARLRPGPSPFAALAAALERAGHGQAPVASAESGDEPGAGHDAGGGSDRQALVSELRRVTGALARELRGLAARAQSRVLLFVDQLEELFTLTDDADERAAFARELCTAADDPLDPVRVVFTLRDDFMSQLAATPEGRVALRHTAVLNQPEAEALREILEQPVARAGYGWDDDRLASDMVQAVQGERSSLALLEFAAHRLWERRDRDEKLLVRAVYDAMGGVAGALADHADGVLGRLSQGELPLARQLLLRLVTPARTRKVLSRPQALAELGASGEAVLGRLTEARLVTARRDPLASGGEAVLEISHEALIVSWGTLARWIDEAHGDILFSDEVNAAAELWTRRGRRREELWQGDALIEAARRAERGGVGLSPLGRAFLAEGRASAERSRRRKRRRLLAVFGTITLAALAVAAVVGWEARNARRERDRAEREAKAARAKEAEALGEGALSAVLQAQTLEGRSKVRMALELGDSLRGRAIWGALRASSVVWQRNTSAQFLALAFAPDGSRVAVAARDGVVHLYDARTSDEVPLGAADDAVVTVAFSPDSQRLAAGGRDGSVRVWEAASGTLLRELPAPHAPLRNVRFAPDGRTLGLCSDAVAVVDVDAADAPRVLADPSPCRTVLFTPDGKTLLSLGPKGVRAYVLETGAQEDVAGARVASAMDLSADGTRLAIARLDRHLDIVAFPSGTELRSLQLPGAAEAVAFSPDGEQVAAASATRALVWDLRSQRPRPRTINHSNLTVGVAFGASSSLLASADVGGAVGVSDLETPEKVDDEGHHAPIFGLAVSPDGSLFATAGFDRTVRLWDARTGAQRAVLRQPGEALGVVFSLDGKALAVAANAHGLRRWDVASAVETGALFPHRGSIIGLAASPQGGELASVGDDGTVRVYDGVHDGQRLVLRGHAGAVKAIDWSADGKLLASGGNDHSVRLWDAATGAAAATLDGHGGNVFDVRFSPRGDHLVSAGEDGARLWPLPGGPGLLLDPNARDAAFDTSGERVVTVGADDAVHIWGLAGEANARFTVDAGRIHRVAWTRDGERIVTAGEDGAVRLWSARSGGAEWRGVALLPGPPRLLSHEGWRRLDADDAPTPGGALDAYLQDHARLACAAPGGETVCALTARGVELWDSGGAAAAAVAPCAACLDVQAFEGGCLANRGPSALLLARSGTSTSLSVGAPITAMAVDDTRLWLGWSEGVASFDSTGRALERFAAAGVVALAAAHGELRAATASGSFFAVRAGAARPEPIRLERLQASRVALLAFGERGTFVVGSRDGLVGLWDDAGHYLAGMSLHGEPTHVLFEGKALYVSTSLGRFRKMDLAWLVDDYCTLLAGVWSRTPTVWADGRAVLADPPADHRCASGR